MNGQLTVYEGLSRRMENAIRSGTLLPGDRLPSVRHLCRQEQVSPGTVLQAFRLLESSGLVEARPRSGYFVRASRRASAPLPDAMIGEAEPTEVGVSDAVTRIFRDASNPEVLALGAALPAPELLPTERLSRILAAVARKDAARLGRYEIAAGHPDLQRELAKWFSKIGCEIPPGEIVVTVGAMEALNLAVRSVARPGEIVAVESPSYFGVLEILESLGIQALPVRGNCAHGIDLDALAQALEDHPVKALILVPSFGNPHGACMSQERRKKLLSLLDDYGVPLIEDDVYADLHFGPVRSKPVRAYDRTGSVLYCGSFSKSLCPGFRIGWIAPGRYRERVRRLKYINTITTPAVLQLALAEFLRAGHYERHLRRVRRDFQQQTARTADTILECFPEGTALSRPEGAFFLWIQLPDGVDSFELYRRALDAKISIVPGPVFCPHGRFRNFVRVSCGLPWSPRLERGLAVLGHLAKELAKSVPARNGSSRFS